MRTAIIKTDFWKDQRVRRLNLDTKLVYLCLISNPERNTTRFMKIDEDYICIQSGIDYRQLEQIKRQLMEAELIYFVGEWVVFSDDSYVVPAKGRLTEKIYERDLATVPNDVLEFYDNRGGVTPEPHLSRSGAAPVYKDKDNNKNKDNNNNKAIVKTSSKVIDELFEKWEEVVGYKISSKLPANRQAVSTLTKSRPPDEIIRMLKGVAMSQEDRYAPRISNFIDLNRKWDELIAWGKRTSSTNASKVVSV